LTELMAIRFGNELVETLTPGEHWTVGKESADPSARGLSSSSAVHVKSSSPRAHSHLVYLREEGIIPKDIPLEFLSSPSSSDFSKKRKYDPSDEVKEEKDEELEAHLKKNIEDPQFLLVHH
jgi:hypothetical protein